MSWKGYTFQMPMYSTAERNTDGSIVQPILILNADTGQQLYKGNSSHWKVWQSLLEEGEQLDERDDVFRWHDRLILQPFTTIDEEGHDIYTVVDYDSGQILYSGPDEEPKEEDLSELESQLTAIVPHHGEGDHGMHLKKVDDQRAKLESSHKAEQEFAAKSLNSQASSSAMLKLTIVRAKDLIAKDRGGTSDPFCNITVGPGGTEPPFYEYKSRVVKKTTAPEFNESYDFLLDPKQRRGLLTIEVFDKDVVSNDDSLGKLQLPLHTLQPLQQYDVWHPLKSEEEEQTENKGQVQLLYKLIPKLPPAILKIEILRAKDLIAADSGGTSDPYVRVHIGDETTNGVKTAVKKKDLNPEWREKFELNIGSDARRDVVTIECFDYDAISADDSLGKFQIALDDLVPAQDYLEWRPFDRDVNDVNDENKGQIEMRYCLLPVLGPAMLDIQVLRARNLLAADRGGTRSVSVSVPVSGLLCMCL